MDLSLLLILNGHKLHHDLKSGQNLSQSKLLNEQFDVLTINVNQQATPICFRQIVLLDFDPRNQENALWGNVCVGDETLHGIPANKFTSCFYISDIKATVSATYYVTDVTQIQPSLPQNTSTILQIDVDIRNLVSLRDSYQYNVFRYVPNPTREEESQSLEKPAGVYCPNRTSISSITGNLSDQISQNSEVPAPQLNSSIVSSHGLYDSDLQFNRFDV